MPTFPAGVCEAIDNDNEGSTVRHADDTVFDLPEFSLVSATAGDYWKSGQPICPVRECLLFTLVHLLKFMSMLNRCHALPCTSQWIWTVRDFSRASRWSQVDLGHKLVVRCLKVPALALDLHYSGPLH